MLVLQYFNLTQHVDFTWAHIHGHGFGLVFSTGLFISLSLVFLIISLLYAFLIKCSIHITTPPLSAAYHDTSSVNSYCICLLFLFSPHLWLTYIHPLTVITLSLVCSSLFQEQACSSHSHFPLNAFTKKTGLFLEKLSTHLQWAYSQVYGCPSNYFSFIINGAKSKPFSTFRNS